jgi:uncharacterized membrane protein YeiB
MNSMGSAMVVLGAALLLTRVRAAQRVLGPLRAAGAMTLTLYSAHVVVLGVGVLDDWETTAQYLFLVAGCLTFAVLWRRRHDQGPLEKLVSTSSTLARQAVFARSAAPAGPR